MKNVIAHLLVFLLWNIGAGYALLFLPPVLGLPLALGLAGLLLWGYVLQPWPNESEEERWDTLRIHPLRRTMLPWALLAIPILLALAWAAGDLYTRIVPVPSASLNPFERIMSTPVGRLEIALFAVAVAPLVEEFVFRGLIQGTLERRFGTTRGIVGASAVFAVVHLLPWIFPLHFMLGIAFGFAVFATRSIWTGVLLHAANNAVAMAGVSLRNGDAQTTGSLWEIGITSDLWLSLAVFCVSLIFAIWIGGRMLSAGRTARLPSA